MNTIASIIIDQEVTHAEQLAKSLRAVTQEIFAPAKPAICDGCNVRPPWEHRCHGGNCSCSECQPAESTIRQHQIRQLKSREAQLQAELNDVRERMAMLEDANYTRFPKETI